MGKDWERIMARPIGLVKSGGRKKGSKNKLTAFTRQSLIDVVQDEISSLPDMLAELDPKDRVDALIKMMAYTLPKVDGEGYLRLDEGEAANDRHNVNIERRKKRIEEGDRRNAEIDSMFS